MTWERLYWKNDVGRSSRKTMCGAAILESSSWGRSSCKNDVWAVILKKQYEGAAILDSKAWRRSILESKVWGPPC